MFTCQESRVASDQDPSNLNLLLHTITGTKTKKSAHTQDVALLQISPAQLKGIVPVLVRPSDITLNVNLNSFCFLLEGVVQYKMRITIVPGREATFTVCMSFCSRYVGWMCGVSRPVNIQRNMGEKKKPTTLRRKLLKSGFYRVSSFLLAVRVDTC